MRRLTGSACDKVTDRNNGKVKSFGRQNAVIKKEIADADDGPVKPAGRPQQSSHAFKNR